MRFSRKKFDNAYDRCWVSIPKSDGSFKNGMDNPDVKEDILNLYRYRCNSKCTAKFRRWLETVIKRHGDPLKDVLCDELLYHYWGKTEYEWWEGLRRTNWFDPREEDTWYKVVEGCRPLFELFEEQE